MKSPRLSSGALSTPPVPPPLGHKETVRANFNHVSSVGKPPEGAVSLKTVKDSQFSCRDIPVEP